MAAQSTLLDVAVRVGLQGPAGPFDLNVELTANAGAFIALIGPSGAGKTTLLRIIAGLMHPDAGRVRLGSSVWCDTKARVYIPTRRRSIGFVFQDYALFPNMTVQRNVEYAIGKRQPEEARRLLQLVELQGLASAYPARLSGGQKQRLALIRALARRPSLLILDEPLSALDPPMRKLLQDELRRLHSSFGTTTFLVSHDVSEILRLADRVIRLEQGRIVFDGSPTAAFGVESAVETARVVVEHISGPDGAGTATVHQSGRLCRVRYRDPPQMLSAGDTVMLNFDEADVRRLN